MLSECLRNVRRRRRRFAARMLQTGDACPVISRHADVYARRPCDPFFARDAIIFIITRVKILSAYAAAIGGLQHADDGLMPAHVIGKSVKLVQA